MAKIRILRLIARLNIGGPAIQGILLTDAFNNNEFESMLVTGIVDKDETEMASLLTKYHVKPVVIPELGRKIRPLDDLMSLYKVYGLIKKYRPHIVHTHTSKAGFIGRLAAFLARTPVTVHTFHGHTFYGYFNRFKTGIFSNIERIFAKFTDAIIAISPLQYKDIVETYRIADKRRCRIISLGLELDKYLGIDPASKRKAPIGFGEDDLIVGTVGRLTGIKNHKLFLEIARLFLDSYKGADVRFAIIGGGELKEDIVNYRDNLKLTDNVHIFGWQDDLVKFYSAFDIFLLTSKNEGTPVSMIEAMASGIPVISTKVGGVPDILKIGATGYLVENFDKGEFVNRLRLLVEDKGLRNSMGMNARGAVKDAFDKKKLVEDLTLLYKELLKRKGVIR